MLRIEDSDEPLPFGTPPLVLGRVIVTWEPVWRVAIATVLQHGQADVLQHWTWGAPLKPDDARRLAIAIEPAIADLSESGRITIPPDLQDADWPDLAMVLETLELLRMLLRLAVTQQHRVETWTD